MKKFIMSYSCGKDSTLALYRMIKEGNKPSALLVTMNGHSGRSWFHGVPENLINEVSKSLDIPLILVKSGAGDNYNERFSEELIKAKEELEIDCCVFGDIDLEPHRQWCTDRCNEAKIEAIFPLWQEDRESLVYEFIDSDFKTVIKNVKLQCMDESFLGKILTKEVVEEIKNTGSDACGENGEYHTFVFDGPIFNYPINFKKEGIVKNETHGFLDVEGVSNE